MTRTKDLIGGVGGLLLLGVLGGPAPSSVKRVAPQDAAAVQHIDIDEGDDVLGRREGPEGEVISGKTRAPRPSLIVVRESFRTEMLQTAAELD